jgi:hypothetical protein
MLSERLKTAHEVRDAYMPLKIGTAGIAAQAAQCAAIMAAARSKVGLKIGRGSDALARILRAAALLAEAEGLIAGAHPELGELIHEAGLTRHFVYGSGYGQEETDKGFTGARERPDLRPVAEAA